MYVWIVKMKIFLLFSVILICLGCMVNIYAEESIPYSVKNNALWWSLDKINDDEFSHSVDLLVFHEFLYNSSSLSENKIPNWFKNTANYWAQNLISDVEFINSLQYLLDHNSIAIQNTVSLPDYKIHQYSGNNKIFKIYTYEKDFYFENDVPIPKDSHFELKSDVSNVADILYDSKKQNSVVIVPILTSSAYWEPGFYTFFRGECDDSCLTTKIEYSKFLGYSASSNAVKILSLLGYPLIYDVDVDNDPNILDQFDSVIVLHNEYVTQNEFEAIFNHSKVLYLYPNSLYGQISINYSDDTITLLFGHGYPSEEIGNGFDWKFDNTHPYEFDSTCINWNFYSIPNGQMLNCYPESLIVDDFEFLKEIKINTLKS